MRILVTGSAGFIGYHLSLFLLKNTNNLIYGIDSLDKYYDVKLKKDRLKILKKYKRFVFYKLNLKNLKPLEDNFKKNKYNCVINLAAQAGVRHSIQNPGKYFESNILGFFNLLEISRNQNIKHLIFASTSSVYGSSNKFPLSEKDNTDKPLSFYAATKKSNEILAYSYSNIYKLPCTALRFFTVYGPFGRPDMSLFKFSKNINISKKIDLYNYGNHIRDWTYVEDVVSGIYKIISKPPKENIPFNIFNVASDQPRSLRYFLKTIENNLGKKAKITLKPLQKGDVLKTHANVIKLKRYINYKPTTSLEKGVSEFIKWFKDYYLKNK